MQGNSDTKVKANAHQDYWRYSLISLLLPIVGLILGIIYLAKDRRLDKKLGEHLLALSVLFIIIWGVMLQLTVLNNSSSLPTADQQTQLQTLSGVTDDLDQQSRDTERDADLAALQGQLEAYFAMNGYYPSSSDLGSNSIANVKFIIANMQGLDKESLRDPLAPAGDYSLASKLTPHKYSYAPSNNGHACDNSKILCNKYVLSVQKEAGGVYTYDSLN